MGSLRPPGVCVWLTGVSGAGKSTVTRSLVPRLEERGHTVSVFDVVPVLAKQPGERTSEGKLLRKAFVAAEVAKHGGIAICVTISARRQVREAARSMVGPDRFVEVLVDVPADIAAERREARGRRTPLRRQLRTVLRRILAAVRHRPQEKYERPDAPEVTIRTAEQTPEECAGAILQVLNRRGFLLPAGSMGAGRSERLEAADA